MSDTFQMVIEIRDGGVHEGSGLRDQILAQLQLDVAPMAAWSVFREAFNTLTAPSVVIDGPAGAAGEA